jgi:hypothetical protein
MSCVLCPMSYFLYHHIIISCHNSEHTPQGFWVAGSMFVTGLAWAALSSEGWRFLAYSTAVPVTLVSAFSLLYLPESPRWLLTKGRVEEAERIVRDAAAVNGVTMAPFSTCPMSNPMSYVLCPMSYIITSSCHHVTTLNTLRFPHTATGLLGGRLGAVKDANYMDLLRSKSARTTSYPLWIVWLTFGVRKLSRLVNCRIWYIMRYTHKLYIIHDT